jgi:hypothetical protein
MKSNNLYHQLILPFFSLFTSTGTLLCCALPAMMVTLGMGAALAGFISVNPWITVISEYKVEVFIISGLLILAAGTMQFRARNAPCPVDPKAAKICTILRRASVGILIFSAIIWAIGFFFAFIAVHLFY